MRSERDYMDRMELRKNVRKAVTQQCQRRGYAVPVDVLMDIGVLKHKDYENWRFGKIRYLEIACDCDIPTLSFIMSVIRDIAGEEHYKPSYSFYGRWGAKKRMVRRDGTVQEQALRFSKTGNLKIEKAYATHYVDMERIAAMKREPHGKQME